MKINPYDIGSREQLTPEQCVLARTVAKDAAMRGLAIGAILKKLREIGIDGLIADEIAAEALVEFDRKGRVLGGVILFFGLCLTGLSVWIAMYIDQRLPIALAMFGGFFVLLGGASFCTRRLPIDTQREKETSRWTQRLMRSLQIGQDVLQVGRCQRLLKTIGH